MCGDDDDDDDGGGKITAAKIKYMRRTAGYVWTDYRTKAQIGKELKITPILDKLLEIQEKLDTTCKQNASRQTAQDNETVFPSWQKESWQTSEETSGYVRPERSTRGPTA